MSIKDFFEKHIFACKNIDSHYVLIFFGKIQISFRHKSQFDYHEATEYGVTTEKRTPQIIVSLTSYPKRIPTLHKVINTLLRQTLKPDRIILWLAYDQFPNKEKDLTEDLLKLKDLGLEIRWCKNLMSFKKLMPALREFTEDIIVTADDDLYYEQDWLETLYNAYKEDPSNIYVQRICRMYFKNNGEVSKHSAKERLFDLFSEPSYLNSPFGGSGCLYPPHCLSDEVFNIDCARELTTSHDDLWFWAMAVLNGTKFCEVSGLNKQFYILDETLGTGLSKTFTADVTLSIYDKLMNKYPQIREKLMNNI